MVTLDTLLGLQPYQMVVWGVNADANLNLFSPIAYRQCSQWLKNVFTSPTIYSQCPAGFLTDVTFRLSLAPTLWTFPFSHHIAARHGSGINKDFLIMSFSEQIYKYSQHYKFRTLTQNWQNVCWIAVWSFKSLGFVCYCYRTTEVSRLVKWNKVLGMTGARVKLLLCKSPHCHLEHHHHLPKSLISPSTTCVSVSGYF